jgi:hypothetical protein
VGTIIGVIAAVIIGGGAATAGGLALIEGADPDASAQVQQKLNAHFKYNPADHPNTVYGKR